MNGVELKTARRDSAAFPRGGMESADCAHAGQKIAAAIRTGTWLDRLEGVDCPQSLGDAYSIQESLAQELGADCAGWKLGCTSEETQKLLNCPEPIVGRILNSAVMRSPAAPQALRKDMLFVEAEYSFRMGRGLPSRTRDYSRQEVEAAIGWVIPSVEIIQSRFVDWKDVSLPEIVADFAGHGRMILGEERPYSDTLNLTDARITVVSDAVEIASGSGAKVLSDPIRALQWFANFNSGRGIGLREGELVAAGTCTGMSTVEEGSRLVVDFEGLGTVEVQF